MEQSDHAVIEQYQAVADLHHALSTWNHCINVVITITIDVACEIRIAVAYAAFMQVLAIGSAR